MNQRKALIVGISGQDGGYLSKLLVAKGYEVHGTSRDSDVNPFESLKALGVYNDVILHSMSLIDFRSVMQVIMETQPDEIYNLAGQSSVALSFAQPVETLESLSFGTLNILEVIRFNKLLVRFYNASSSECFGSDTRGHVNERSPFYPRSPYAIAKSTAHWLTAQYRDAYNIFALSGILFNHDSPLRPLRFVTRKISLAAAEICAGKAEKLVLGNLDSKRDWGYAPEYVEGMWRMVQVDEPEDFVLATGEAHTVREFADLAFKELDLELEWVGDGINEKGVCKRSGKVCVEVDERYYRPTEIGLLIGDTSKARVKLGWEPKTRFQDLVKLMVRADYKKIMGK